MSAQSNIGNSRFSASKGSGGGDVDTNSPLQLVKETVTEIPFGGFKLSERKPSRLSSFSKRRSSASKETEYDLIMEELIKAKEQLVISEMDKKQLSEELMQSKATMEDLKLKLHSAMEASRKSKLRAEEMELASYTAAEDWKAESDAMKQEFDRELDEVRNLREELAETRRLLEERNRAMEEAGMMERKLSGELANARIDHANLSSLLITKSSELAEANESKMEMSLLLVESRSLRDELAETKRLLEERNRAIEEAGRREQKLSGELANARIDHAKLSSLLVSKSSELVDANESKMNTSLLLANARADLERGEVELTRARSRESEAIAIYERLSKELDEKHVDLQKAEQDRDKYVSLNRALRVEIDGMHQEIIDLRNVGKALCSELILLSEIMGMEMMEKTMVERSEQRQEEEDEEKEEKEEEDVGAHVKVRYVREELRQAKEVVHRSSGQVEEMKVRMKTLLNHGDSKEETRIAKAKYRGLEPLILDATTVRERVPSEYELQEAREDLAWASSSEREILPMQHLEEGSAMDRDRQRSDSCLNPNIGEVRTSSGERAVELTSQLEVRTEILDKQWCRQEYLDQTFDKALPRKKKSSLFAKAAALFSPLSCPEKKRGLLGQVATLFRKKKRRSVHAHDRGLEFDLTTKTQMDAPIPTNEHSTSRHRDHSCYQLCL